MSLESTIASLVTAANNLTATVTSKIAGIDAKVAESVKGVPVAIQTSMDSLLCVDAVNGNDANLGKSWAAPVRTIEGAMNRTVSGARVSILLKPGSVYTIPADISCDNRTISIQPTEYTFNDKNTYTELRAETIIAGDGELLSGGFLLGYGSVLNILGCKLSTAKFSAGQAGKYNYIYRTSFFKTNTAHSVVILQHCAVEINNGSLMYQHSAGSIGLADLIMRNVFINKVAVAGLPVPAGNQYLMGTYGGQPIPFSLYGIEMVRQGASTWAELINQDLTNARSNLRD